MRPNAYHGIDTESLQADVMRFMAIIAFCLIAILALVRNTEAPPISATAPPAISPKLTVTLQPKPQPNPPAPPRTTEPALEPIVVEPIVVEPIVVERVVRTAPQPIPPLPQPEPVPVVKPVPEVAKVEFPVEQTPPQPADEPLSLRFVSDRDFLRLISKGDVKVYLFNGHDVRELAANYQFVDSKPPGELYELLPQTIPAAINDAALRSGEALTDFKWGIRIPGRMERQISHYVASVNSGELLIDRFGKVHHVQSEP